MLDVEATLLAQQQINRLRSKQRQSYDDWVERVRHKGCAALDYRLTGETLERLCCVHLIGTLRVIVAFKSPDFVVVVLVGPHLDQDPDLDVYTMLYELLDVPVPAKKRTKPPCCGDDDLGPLWGEEVDQIFDQARKLARRR